MAQVVWTRSALNDLREIGEYVARDSPANAKKLVARLKDAPRLLETVPKLGRAVPEFGREDLRELVTVRPYRILYAFNESEDRCAVLAIVHGRRDLKSAFQPDDEGEA